MEASARRSWTVKMEKIHVKAGKEYDVLVGSSLLEKSGELITGTCSGIQKLLVVTDSNVEKLYLSKLKKSLTDAGFQVYEFIFAAGEQSKNLDTIAKILGTMAINAFTRTDAVVALGGGVTTDMAGFAASIFLRGIKVFQIPTSLLAQVDASVGGKTGVDLPQGKNLVGSFYQPSLVIADTSLLSSLDDDVFIEGMAEVIKHAFIRDESLYKTLRQKVTKSSPELEQIVAQNIRIKAEVVAQDEHDNGLRQILNFGHTIGHAIESRSNYTIPHGFAVAKGMERITRTSPIHGEIVEMLKLYGLPYDDPITSEQIMQGVMNDKKKRGGKITIALLNKIGHGELKTIQIDELGQYL